jgi:PKHD-type hydroxylase
MQVKNSYFWFKEALSPEVCQKIVDQGIKQIEHEKSAGKNVAATTFGDNHKQGLEEQGLKPEAQADKTTEEIKTELGVSDADIEKARYIRDSEVTWMNDQWLYDLVYPYLHEANDKAGWKYEFSCSESFQFTKYGINQFYGWHADGNSCHLGKYKRAIPGVTPRDEKGMFPRGYTDNPNMVNKIRKLSMTINLNKPGEYEGGNLKFDFGPHATGNRFHECVEIRPQGSIIIFPSYVYHQVTPVTSGTRYSLVLWTLGQPFK